MEMRCQKCGSSVNADQAFCSKCGAVVGMSDTAQQSGDEWNMAATMVGKKMPLPESSRPAVVRQSVPDAPRPAPPPQQQYTPSQPQQPPPYAQPAASSNSNAMLLAVIGLVAVLLIGALLALLFYLNSQG
jgi:hypothetical protein